MKHILKSGHEYTYGQGLEVVFKPIENCESIIEGLNEIYDNTNGEFFTIQPLNDGDLKVNACVYHIDYHDDIEELREANWDGEDVQDRLKEILDEFNLSEEAKSFIKGFILEEQIFVATLINRMMAKGQSVTCTLIDDHYGSEEITLDS